MHIRGPKMPFRGLFWGSVLLKNALTLHTCGTQGSGIERSRGEVWNPK